VRVRIVGSVLVRNEDVFVANAIRNVSDFCDVIHVVDHMSEDRTWEIVRSLAAEYDNLDVRRSRTSAVAHKLLEQYAGTPTWVLGVDGDELYDPTGLTQLRTQLQEGAHADVFRVKAHVLNCDGLDVESRQAVGWLAPPSRPVTKLFNFAAVESWTRSPDPLQTGDAVFRPGFHWESRRDLATETDWRSDPLRCLHTCFLRRSSLDLESGPIVRLNLDESRLYDRGPIGRVKRRLRARGSSASGRSTDAAANWKQEWYARGPKVAVDASPFLERDAQGFG